MSESDVVVVERKGLKIKNPVVINGFPGPGFVGSMAASHLIMGLGMREIGHVESKIIPPMKIIVGGEMRSVYPLRIYINQRGDLLVIREEGLGAISSSGFWDIARGLVDWLSEKRVKEAIFLEGNPVQKAEESTVFFYCTDYERSQDLRQHGIDPLFEGGVSGINAGMIEESTKRKIPWVVLFTYTTRLVGPADFRAAALIVEALNKILGVDVDTETLLDQASRTQDLRGGKGVLRSIRNFVVGK